MDQSPRDRPPSRSRRRDSEVRSVSRATKTVAAVAVLGTAAFGGLAATGATSAPAGASPKTATAPAPGGASAPTTDLSPIPSDPYASPDDGSTYYYSDDDGGQTYVPASPSQDFSAAPSAPTYTPQPPIASSGGS